MKISTLFAYASVALNFVISKQVDYSFTTEDFKYNFYCLEGSKELCKSLKSELYQAVNSISDIIGTSKALIFILIINKFLNILFLIKYNIEIFNFNFFF